MMSLELAVSSHLRSLCDASVVAGGMSFNNTATGHIISLPAHTGSLAAFGPTFPLVSCSIAALAWAVYDHVITCQDEVLLIWRKPIRTGTVLFLLVRYGGLACMSAVLGIYLWPHPEGGLAILCNANSDPSMVQFTTPWQNRLQWELAPLLQFTTFWAVEVILQLRVYALWGSRFARYNASVFLVMICAMLALWADWSTAPSRCDQPFPAAPADFSAVGDGASPAELGCSMFPLYWAPGLVYELWLVSLALFQLRRRVLKNDILSVVIQDSVIYFLLIAAVMVVHLTLSFVGLGRYAVSFVIASQTIGGSRVVLHLRKSHYKAYELSLNSTSAPMAFALRSSISMGLVDESFFDTERV